MTTYDWGKPHMSASVTVDVAGVSRIELTSGVYVPESLFIELGKIDFQADSWYLAAWTIRWRKVLASGAVSKTVGQSTNFRFIPPSWVKELCEEALDRAGGGSMTPPWREVETRPWREVETHV